ncbi:hypothetical protein K5I29_00350 [Flavobacterium agricola]|uniref:Uncharacterized protein n=1 Tax=Flavobacterium agricola TaxID=2870839 RepID=A0ABY6LYN2_9FLAO|nr:hypothetical protein [Flavobacterium agricola]UYW01445.1 hypothetical protein K5I29_00350 [Flavobacterium agricola]
MALLETQIANEYDYLVYITEQCIKKGHNFDIYNAKLPADECEICKLHFFVLNVALLDNEILEMLYAFENKFWSNAITCKTSYRDIIDLHINHENIHILNFN